MLTTNSSWQITLRRNRASFQDRARPGNLSPSQRTGGLIFPQFNLKAYPEVFQIFSTRRKSREAIIARHRGRRIVVLVQDDV